MLIALSPLVVGLIIGGGVLLVVTISLLLYFFVFRIRKYKKQIKEIARKFSYLDSLLVGQDSQYIHRLEVISTTNLLYVEKYLEFSKRFKEIFQNEDKFAESMIKQLNSLVAASQFKEIKPVIADARKAVQSFETKVNGLDHDLYSLIKLEEDERQVILSLKEDYRHVKQSYFSLTNELEYVAPTFNKVFDKLDASFANIEQYIESAEYDEANAIVPNIKNVIVALNNALNALPNLCSLINNIIPTKLSKLQARYKDVERSGIPLYHLGFKAKVSEWNKSLKDMSNKIFNLKTAGVANECDRILNEIEDFYTLLDNELQDEELFKNESDKIYREVFELEKSFLRVCSLLPELKNIYYIDEEQNAKIDELRASIDKLGESRRILDGFIHSGTKQPFSLLKAKLDSLKSGYEVATTGVKEFKAYVDSLRVTVEEAYKMVFAYYYRLKEVENYIYLINIPNVDVEFKDSIDKIYEEITTLNEQIKEKPINVNEVTKTMESLKSFANEVFDEIENKYRECQLAESAIVYANRDRNHQNDVHQQLCQLENVFYQGEFDKVYRDANAIYCRNHIEENNGR